MCYSKDCHKTAIDESIPEADKEANKAKCKDVAKKEGLRYKEKKDEDKEVVRATTIAQTTEDLVALPGIPQVTIPNSLKYVTKENQTCTIKSQQPKEKKIQKLKINESQPETFKIQLKERKNKNKKSSKKTS